MTAIIPSINETRPGTTLTDDQLAAIGEYDVCTLSNAIETFGVRLPNEGFADASIRCLVNGPRRMLGYAATARIRASSTPVLGKRCPDRSEWWEYLLTLPAPRVVVLEDVSEQPGLGAYIGEVHSAILQRLDCVGAVTNGAVRDLDAVEKMGFPLFAANVAVSHCFAQLVEFGEPVKVGGLEVRPGDLICGDRHGVLSIPVGIAAEVPAAAARLVAKERRILDVCCSPEFSIQKLRAAMR